MEIDSPESCRLFQECQAVVYKHLGHGVLVLVLTWQLEAGTGSAVLVETGAFRQAAERPFDHAKMRIKLLVRQRLFVHAGKLKQAPITSALERECVLIDKEL